MKTLLIDDMRTIDADVIARTFEAGIHALRYLGPFDLLYLDHDLGDMDLNTGMESEMYTEGLHLICNGYGVMCFLEANPQYLPKEIKIVSSNPVGRHRMQTVINRLYRETT